MLKIFIILLGAVIWASAIEAQDSSKSYNLSPVSKYFNDINNKADKYRQSVTAKTEKTLEKLSRWEDKIKTTLLKVNPKLAEDLFSNEHLTFSSLLQSVRNGESTAANYSASYNKYLDEVNTQTAYFLQQKDQIQQSVKQKAADTKAALASLDSTLSNTEAIEEFIKERKKELLNQCSAYLINSKQLSRINKEAYYYAETLKNYKEIFSDANRAEETAMKLLNKLPAFEEFMQRNSQLASLFGIPVSGATIADNAASDLSALQTRESVLNSIQNNFSSGTNPQQILQQNLADAQEQMNTLKEKIRTAGAEGSDDEMPNFKVNTERSKKFLQRIEYGTNLQFQSATDILPAVANIALQAGYKLNTRSTVGFGASYRMGYGSVQRIAITHQGVGLRSYVDWKLKKEFYISGGYEMNYNTAFRNIQELNNNTDLWQKSGLLGISKRFELKTKWFKGTKIQLLYDMLHNLQTPASQAFVFRMGYTF